MGRHLSLLKEVYEIQGKEGKKRGQQGGEEASRGGEGKEARRRKKRKGRKQVGQCWGGLELRATNTDVTAESGGTLLDGDYPGILGKINLYQAGLSRASQDI